MILKLTKYLIIGTLLITMFCCKNRTAATENKSAYVRIYQNSYFDSVFYPNGQLKILSEKIKGERNGWQYEFSKTSKLKAKIQYRKDIPNGLNYSYFDSGQVESVGRWMNGKVFGDVTFYYINGKVEQYSCYDFQAHCRYREKYSTEGTLLSKEGKLICQLLIDGDFDSTYANMPFNVNLCASNPPFTTEKFRVIEMDSKGTIVDEQKVLPIDNVISLTKKFTAKGKMIQLAIAESYDDHNNLVESDSLITNFLIK